MESTFKGMKRPIDRSQWSQSTFKVASKQMKVIERKPTFTEELSFVSKSTTDNFHKTMSEFEFDKYDVELVVLGHMTKGRWNQMHSKALMRLMNCWESLAISIAKKNLYFTNLKDEDQALLLQNNAPLFKEYCIARYITADTGIDQLSWIIGLDIKTSISKFYFLLH